MLTFASSLASNIAFVNMEQVYEFQRTHTPVEINNENKELIQVIHKYIQDGKPFVDMRKNQIKQISSKMNSIQDKQSDMYQELLRERNKYQSEVNFVHKQFFDQMEKVAPDLPKYRLSNIRNIDKTSKEIIEDSKYDVIIDTRYLAGFSSKMILRKNLLRSLKE